MILVQESETLESQNHDLKSQIQELETQRRRLVDMLSLHGPTCLKQTGCDGNVGNGSVGGGSGGSCSVDDVASPNESYHQSNIDPLILPNYQDNFASPVLNQTQNCVTDYPLKVKDFETTGHHHHHQGYYRQENTFVPTSDAGCTV